MLKWNDWGDQWKKKHRGKFANILYTEDMSFTVDVCSAEVREMHGILKKCKYNRRRRKTGGKWEAGSLETPVLLPPGRQQRL